MHIVSKKKDFLCPQFESNSMGPSLLPRGEVIGRNDRIGTRDILYPKQRRYQAALHPFQLVYDGHCRESLPCFPHRYFLHRYQISLAIYFFGSLLIYILIIPPLLPTLTYLFKGGLNKIISPLNKRGFPDRNSCMRKGSQFRVSG